MFVCEECGSGDFNVHDGLYFCTSCHTRSQDFVDESVPDEYAFSLISSGSNISRHRIFERKGRQKQECENGREWATYEAFNIILKKQVDVLVSMGASQNFKTTVRELWLAYLRLLGLFPDEQSGYVPKLQLCPRKRDYDVILQKRKVVSSQKLYYRQKRYRERRLGISGYLISKRTRQEKNEATTDGNSSPTLTEFGYLSDPSGSELSSLLESKAASYPCHKIASKHYKRRKEKPNDNDIRLMKLSHTLCFLYLGALISNEQMLLSDIIRWTVEGHLPLYDAAVNVLPANFTFQTWDNMIFRLRSTITPEFLLKRCSLLVKFIGLKDIPAKPIEVIAARLILELDLPVSFIGIVSSLVHLAQKSGRVSAVPDYESRAAACILITLKLLFGLDGTSEILLSNLAKLLNGKNDGCEYFVLTDWCQKIYVLNEARKRSIQHSIWLRKLSCDVDAVRLPSYLASDCMAWRGRFIVKRVKKYETKTKEVIDSLARPFKSLKDVNCEEVPSSKTPSVCFLPKNRETFVKQYGYSVVTASYDKWFARKFSSTSLEFITDHETSKFDETIDTFLESLDGDYDVRLLRPWMCYRKSQPKSVDEQSEDKDGMCASPHFSFILDVFSAVLMVRKSTIMRQISSVENIFFPNGLGMRARKSKKGKKGKNELLNEESFFSATGLSIKLNY